MKIQPTTLKNLVSLHFVPILLYLILSLVLLRNLLFTPGTIGHNWDWYIPPLAAYVRDGALNILSSWSENVLGFPTYIGRVPHYALLFLLGFLGIGGEPISKLILLSSPAVSSYFAYLLMRKVLRPESYGRNICSFIGGLVYGFSGASFDWLLAGSIPVLLGFALAPLCMLSISDLIDAIAVSKILPVQQSLKVTLTFSLMSLTSTPNFILVSLVAAIQLTFAVSFRRLNNFKMLAKCAGLVVAGILLSSSFIILPLAFYTYQTGNFQVPQGVMNPRNYLSFSSEPSLVFTNVGFFARDMFLRSVNGSLAPIFIVGAFFFVAVSILVATTNNFRKGSRLKEQTLVSFSIYIIATGLAAGNRILGPIAEILYSIPVAVFLRSLEYYLTYVALGLSILISIALIKILNGLSFKKYFLFFLLISFIGIYLLPWSSGDLGASVRKQDYDGTLDVFRVPSDYEQAFSMIAEDSGTFNVLAIPMSFTLYFFPTDYQRTGYPLLPNRYIGPEPTLLNSKHGVITGDTNIYQLTDQTRKIIAALKELIYQMKLEEPQNETMVAMIVDDNQTGFWKIGLSGNGTRGYLMFNDNMTKVSLKDALRLVQVEGSHNAAYLYHAYSAPQNWTVANTLSFYFYGRGDGQTYTVEIRAPDADNRYLYRFVDRFTGWRRITIDLTAPIIRQGHPDLANVREIRIWDFFTGEWFLDKVYLALTQYEPTSNLRLQFMHLLSIFNVKYVVFLKNVAPGDIDTSEWNSSKVYNFLKEIFGGYVLVDGPSTSLFRVPEEFFTQRLYIANTIIYSNFSDYNQFLQLVAQTGRKPGGNIAFVQDGLKFLPTTLGNATIISWKQISPTEYRLVINCTGPYVLVLSQSYNPLWKLSLGGTDQSTTESIFESQHFVANGYANSWLINASGVHNVTIIFSLQPIFDFALLTSCFSLVFIGLLYVIYYSRSRIRRDMSCAFD